jgi:hypothetical protein
MVATYASYQTLLEAKAAELDDAVAQAKCELLIDQYVDALEAQATAVSTDVTSYTIGGRTVSRGDVLRMQGQVSNLERQINNILYGNVSYADFNVQVNQRYT